ncbi:hypothetical protein Tco_0705003 [Tanacetum coccineum]|uniref:Uncharacterized protein n=1 Tax=Tanacetum coccineum TaxID=301880 RepID=A0ABQ4Y592_9ASTR
MDTRSRSGTLRNEEICGDTANAYDTNTRRDSDDGLSLTTPGMQKLILALIHAIKELLSTNSIKRMTAAKDPNEKNILMPYALDSRRQTTKQNMKHYWPVNTSSTDSQMHNNIMAAGSKDRPPMLGPGRYSQWRSRFLRYIDTKANVNSPEVPEHDEAETVHNMSEENKLYFQAEKEAYFLSSNWYWR